MRDRQRQCFVLQSALTLRAQRVAVGAITDGMRVAVGAVTLLMTFERLSHYCLADVSDVKRQYL